MNFANLGAVVLIEYSVCNRDSDVIGVDDCAVCRGEPSGVFCRDGYFCYSPLPPPSWVISQRFPMSLCTRGTDGLVMTYDELLAVL